MRILNDRRISPMKKFIALLCALALILSALPALAESREKPEDKKVITTDDVIGAETVFKKYDNKFYDAPSTQPGTVVRLDYTTTPTARSSPVGSMCTCPTAMMKTAPNATT